MGGGVGVGPSELLLLVVKGIEVAVGWSYQDQLCSQWPKQNGAKSVGSFYFLNDGDVQADGDDYFSGYL